MSSFLLLFLFSSQLVVCISSLICQSPSYPSSTSDKCICPIDLTGDSCQLARPFKCSYTLLSPSPVCIPVVSSSSSSKYSSSQPVVLDSDPSCFRSPQQNSIQFRYNIKCQFLNFDTSGLTSKSEQIRNFDYFVLANDYSFAISRVVNWTLIMKFFNFNQFTDLSASLFSPPLRPAQLAKKSDNLNRIQNDHFPEDNKNYQNFTASNHSETLSLGERDNTQDSKDSPSSVSDVFFTVDVHSIPDRFYAGGRLYFEVGLDDYRQKIDGLLINQRDRQFIDVYDYKRPPAESLSMPQWQRVLIVVACILGVVAVVWFIYWYRRRLNNQRLIKDR